MAESQHVNLKTVAKVASSLGDINEEVVYVGGAVISLYVERSAAEEPRPTMDVDLSVQISTYAEMDALRERLAKKGIYPASDQEVLYRFHLESILIDFIPWESSALGPTNSWLKPGFPLAIENTISGQKIRILPLSYFLATKWEAYQSRGGDPRMSHDFEDLIYLLFNSERVVPSFLQSPTEVKNYLQQMAHAILNHPYRNEILECHLPYEQALPGRTHIIRVLEQILAAGGA